MQRKVAAIDGRGQGVCLEEATPTLGSGEVKVRVEASLISPGTELGRVRAMRENPQPDRPPRPFGYTNAGVVEEIGAGVEQFEVGQGVACMGGGYALHADWVCVPQNLCAAIPEGVSFVEAASVHLAATGLHAVRRTAPLYGENGIVVGLGLVGQFTAQFARVDRFARRRDIARQVGVECVVDPSEQDVVEQAGEFTQGYGMDFGVIAFGGEASDAFGTIYQSLKQAPDTHRMGRIVLVGGAQVTHGFGSALGNVDVRSAARTGPGYHDPVYECGQAYPEVFVEWPTQRNLAECLSAMAAGKLRVQPLYTHEFALEQIAAAVDVLVESPAEALGVVLKPAHR
ncbi:MAG: zinc-binding alcohol dehydrogenase [Candidatus Latescibacteria bacterium]|nr:zinc-binding alcohol dehydrogenase [Candidatus Latescibacterota bacterium]